MPQVISDNELIELLPEINEIEDETIRNGVIEIWKDVAAEMSWQDLREVPKSVGLDSCRSLIQHVRGVVQIATMICKIEKEFQDRPYDHDFLVAACLLHDVSKAVETEPTSNGAIGQSSLLGQKLQHAVYAAHKIIQVGLPLELANMVICHTHQSSIRGRSWESAALFYADFADTDAALSLINEKMWSERVKLS